MEIDKALWAQNRDFDEALKRLFDPDSVAVIGASDNPGKLGFHVMKSLVEGGFQKPIVPINPKTKRIMGLPVLSAVSELKGPIDLAIIVVPAKNVPETLEQCRAKKVKGIVLITAGFKEIDDPLGTDLQTRLAQIANSAGIPVIGPNTFGMVNLHSNLNASFTPEFSSVPKGNVALVSQSGGMSHLLGFMAMRESAGLSKIVGLGNRLNLDFADMVAFLMEDAETKVLALYLEGLDHPRRLMATADKYRGKKPILAYKTGSAATGDQASLSHTGSMAGRHEIYQGALRQAGILCLESAEFLLDAAKVLSNCPLPADRGVAVLSGQAGPAMAACDVCEARGLEVVRFGSQTQQEINDLLPPLALRTNPVDMGPAWYDSAAIRGIVKAVLGDPAVDAVVLLMMFASANRQAIMGLSELLKEWKQRKPVVGCFLAPPGIWDEEIRVLEQSGCLVNLPTPERAAVAVSTLWRYAKTARRGS